MSALIDLERDELVPLAKLVEQRLGHRVSPPTLWRWRTKGARGVRLECYYAAGRWYSTARALAAFLRASSSLPPQPNVADPPAERPEATRRQLEAAGLLLSHEKAAAVVTRRGS